MADVDAAVVIMREAWHPRVAIDLLAAGKHVFIEKPLAPSAVVGEEMVRASRDSGCLLMVGYMKRYDDGVRIAREVVRGLLASGELGRPTMVRLHCFGGDWICGLRAPVATDEPAPAYPGAPGPDNLPQKLHGPFAVFLNVYCHNLNLLRFFLGDEVDSLAAHWTDNAKLILLDAGGVPVSAEFGHMSAHAWDESTTFYFEHGRVEVLTPPPLLRNVPARVVVYRTREKGEVIEPLLPWTWAFANEARAFVNTCLGRDECVSRAEDALKDLILAERIGAQAAEEALC
ncbi:MAG: Gfo/Idh/MocA family oxidoreductase, partial [Armatimonadetes bacterium]|nr:Gfo/Idh/MocA family oxidoreductase [Armatimonadota bacterium]